ncbi:MAG UNVERIFIED_CONTAM: hypothetical protein LVQ98_01895 [Rickettsiaceae bacterium]|jgi:ABC-type transporter MlaC component
MFWNNNTDKNQRQTKAKEVLRGNIDTEWMGKFTLSRRVKTMNKTDMSMFSYSI